jgi:hypothetical protein
MTGLLIVLVVLISLLLVGRIFVNPIPPFVQALHKRGDEGEQFLLWGGMILTTFGIGLLVLYLFL